MRRGYFFTTPFSNATLNASRALGIHQHYQWRFHSNIFSFKDYSSLCVNEFCRYDKNPNVTGYLLLQKDVKKDSRNAQVYQFDFQESFDSRDKSQKFPLTSTRIYNGNYYYITPAVKKISRITAYEDTQGTTILEGQTSKRDAMIGYPACEINFQPKRGFPQHYTFYPMIPKNAGLTNPISIPRIVNTPEGKRIHKHKDGYCKSKQAIKITSSRIRAREKITKRDPDQNTVMNQKAVDAYSQCAREYQSILNPTLFQILMYCANILHRSTLRAMKKRGEKISQKEIERYLNEQDIRPEWLHLYGFAYDDDPQSEDNLGAARAKDNTRMLLLERLIKWIALNIPHTQNELFGYFDMLLDSEVIEHIDLNISSKLNGTTVDVHQKIDPLVLNPNTIRASDLAGLVGIITLLLQSKRPQLLETVTIKPSPNIVIPQFADTHCSFFEFDKVISRDKSQRVSEYLDENRKSVLCNKR